MLAREYVEPGRSPLGCDARHFLSQRVAIWPDADGKSVRFFLKEALVSAIAGHLLSVQKTYGIRLIP